MVSQPVAIILLVPLFLSLVTEATATDDPSHYALGVYTHWSATANQVLVMHPITISEGGTDYQTITNAKNGTTLFSERTTLHAANQPGVDFSQEPVDRIVYRADLLGVWPLAPAVPQWAVMSRAVHENTAPQQPMSREAMRDNIELVMVPLFERSYGSHEGRVIRLANITLSNDPNVDSNDISETCIWRAIVDERSFTCFINSGGVDVLLPAGFSMAHADLLAHRATATGPLVSITTNSTAMASGYQLRKDNGFPYSIQSSGDIRVLREALVRYYTAIPVQDVSNGLLLHGSDYTYGDPTYYELYTYHPAASGPADDVIVSSKLEAPASVLRIPSELLPISSWQGEYVMFRHEGLIDATDICFEGPDCVVYNTVGSATVAEVYEQVDANYMSGRLSVEAVVTQVPVGEQYDVYTLRNAHVLADAAGDPVLVRHTYGYNDNDVYADGTKRVYQHFDAVSLSPLTSDATFYPVSVELNDHKGTGPHGDRYIVQVTGTPAAQYPLAKAYHSPTLAEVASSPAGDPATRRKSDGGIAHPCALLVLVVSVLLWCGA